MRRLTLLLSFVAPATLAQYQYIVPVGGEGYGINMFFGSRLQVMNRGAATATVRVSDVYPAAGSAPCSFIPPPIHLAPAQSGFMIPICGPLYAFVVESDQPLAASATVQTTLNEGKTWSEETVGVERLWFPANRDVAIVGVRFLEGESRAALIVVNPNGAALHVKAHLIRPELAFATADREFVIAPHSISMQPLQPVAGNPPPRVGDDPIVITGSHDLIVTADAPFACAATSVIPFMSLAVYRRAELVEP
jgi:hypothetical protein